MSEKQEFGEIFQPSIVAFFCNFCDYLHGELTETSLDSSGCKARITQKICPGRLDPHMILASFLDGADAVFVGDCRLEDCLNHEKGARAERRFAILKEFLKLIGIEQDRLRHEWIDVSESDKIGRIMREMADVSFHLGPLRLQEEQCRLISESLSECPNEAISAEETIL